MMQETKANTNEKNGTANSITIDQINLFWSLSQTATAFNFSVEFYIFLSLLLYERRTGRFKGKLNDPMIIGKIITSLCPVFAMLNLLLTEAMILADKFLTQHRHGDYICLILYDIRSFTYPLAALTPYIFLWYRVLSIYKIDSFLSQNTRSVRVLKVCVLCAILSCVVIGIVAFFLNDGHRMTSVGCVDESRTVDDFTDLGTLIAQIIAFVALIGLMLYPLLSHKRTFGEMQDQVTRKMVMRATKVSIISVAVVVSVDSIIIVLHWFYPVNWTVLPTHALFDFSVFVKTLTVVFFFHEPFEMFFGWWKRGA